MRDKTSPSGVMIATHIRLGIEFPQIYLHPPPLQKKMMKSVDYCKKRAVSAAAVYLLTLLENAIFYKNHDQLPSRL
jgi:hypothetical protein